MNHLANESSPYLRQHAENPVEWYPWGTQAHERARREDKPLLVSVGYASCHWCHVMAHESFEDPATAAVMNDLFVNVKVDREERPDIDAVYMEATQAMTGHGGWPMTVFTTPDGRPFFAGTYFPKQAQAGRPGFVELLHAVDEAWRTQRGELEDQADELREAIRMRTTAQPGAHDLHAHGDDWLQHATVTLAAAYDVEWGGFGPAPKFPQPWAMELLLQRGGSDAERDVAMVTNTLDAMVAGGIYDHLGGGFSRYSVDAFWMVPHFEKMLTDQAALLPVLVHAFQVTGFERYRQVAEELVAYVLRDLDPTGTGMWCSGEDADSEGEEGVFYTWRPEAIDAVLGDDELSARVQQWYGVTKAGNFEGANILHRPVRGEVARPADIESARARLFAARATRVRPGLDDKVLTEWNAMMVAALAEAGPALGHPEWVGAAARCAELLCERLRTADGRWARSWHPSSGARHHAVAADHAWLVHAFTRLAEATGEARWRALATEAAELLVDHFWDDEHGGLFTTADDAEQLVVRTKELFDGASASANSVAAHAFVRLAAVTGDVRWIERAESIVRLVAEPLSHHPTAFTNMCRALDILVGTRTETVIAGDHLELVRAVQAQYLPRDVLLWGERDASPLWEGRDDGAYVCRDQTCSLPMMEADDLLRELTRPAR